MQLKALVSFRWLPVCGKKMGVLGLGVASDRLIVACAKAHKGGDAKANKVALCEAPGSV